MSHKQNLHSFRMKSKTKHAIYPFTKFAIAIARCDEIPTLHREILYARDRTHFDPDFFFSIMHYIFSFLLAFFCNSILCSAQLHNGPHLNCNLVERKKNIYQKCICCIVRWLTLFSSNNRENRCVCARCAPLIPFIIQLLCGNRMNDPSVRQGDAI